MIEVEVIEDGGNPRDPAAISRLGDGHYRVVPFSEDGDANYTFALNVRARNDGSTPATLRLDVDWGDRRYMPSRGFFHVQGDETWEMLPARVEDTTSRLRCDLPPGSTDIGLSPAYGLGAHAAYAAPLTGQGYRREVIGRSAQGREIETFSIGEGHRRILVTARLHPYETAASYCVEGLLRWLAGPDDAARRLRQQARLAILPMPNPDGVYLGLCKRTGIGGADLSHDAVGSADPTAGALLGLLASWQPQDWLDIHGWMHDDEDGLHYHDADLAERFLRAAEAQPALSGNRWKGSLERPNPGAPRWEASRRFGTAALAVSYRWPGRTVAAMRAVGAATLPAYATP